MAWKMSRVPFLVLLVISISHSAHGMGVLTVGKPLTWAQAIPHLKYVRQHGVLQFINKYQELKGLKNKELMWGDEIEYSIVALDPETRVPRISLRAEELRAQLSNREASEDARGLVEGCNWMPEYGAWMLEGTPRSPYAGYSNDLMRVERNMRMRRARLMAALAPNEVAPTLTVFPLLGASLPKAKHGADASSSSTSGSSDAVDFTVPMGLSPGGPISASAYVPDECINPHPRFGTLTQNIRARRGSKVDIRMPLFHDTQTPEFDSGGGIPREGVPTCPPVCGPGGAMEAGPTSADAAAAAVPCVEMDAMAFGMGCCCLQVTFQARDVDESRYMFDQLAVLSPLFLALTAATPVMRGRLLDTDVRWPVIAASCDDRTPAERGFKNTDRSSSSTTSSSSSSGDASDQSSSSGGGGGEWHSSVVAEGGCTTITDELGPSRGSGNDDDGTGALGASVSAEAREAMVGGGKTRLAKSRYGSVSGFIYHDEASPGMVDRYNDLVRPLDAWSLETLLAAGVDAPLARHVAHLFVRDPLVLFDGLIEEVDDATSADHFENIQSTNWQTCRWKPPPASSSGNGDSPAPAIGWRTEFRPMEVQVTDFENAAFSVLVVLVTRVILAYDLMLYIPMSLVDENMARATKRNAVLTEKFWFRKDIAPPQGRKGGPCDQPCGPPAASASPSPSSSSSEDSSTAKTAKISDCGHTEGSSDGSSCCDGSEFEEMTAAEILLGKGDYYPGLLPLVYAYLDHIKLEPGIKRKVHRYLELAERRATGELPTAAKWIRDFIQAHPSYQHDSVVGPEVAHALLERATEVGDGRCSAADLIGTDNPVKPIVPEAAYDQILDASKIGEVPAARDLIAAYMQRSSHRAMHRSDTGLNGGI